MREQNIIKFYMPLQVRLNRNSEPFNFISELEDTDGTDYMNEISDAIGKRIGEHPLGIFKNKPSSPVTNRIVSVDVGLEEHNHELFGTVTFHCDKALDSVKKRILQFWTREEMESGWGSMFENTPIPADDGDIYVSFYNETDEYEILTEDEFFGIVCDEGIQLQN